MKKLKLLDTFSGIGGFSYAAEKLVGGFETTQFIEIDPYCQKILKKHWPNIPIHDDITTFTAKPFQYDAVCGGFPCQDISTAGRGEGITQETRSGLFYELMRIIRMVRPKFVVMENVAAILNNGLDIVLGELSEAGYDAEWSIISASSLGACHQRSRWWLIAYPNSKQSNRTESQIQAGRIFSSSSNRSGNVTDSDNNGSSSTEKSRGSKKTNGRVKERKDTASDSKGSSQPTNSGAIQFNATDTKSSDWNGDENKQRDGKPRTQEIFRDRNSSQSSHTWRFTKHRLNPDWRGYISEPCLLRGNDGLRNRVDRLKALGNSVVPQVAAIPLQRVKDIHEQLTSVDH